LSDDGIGNVKEIGNAPDIDIEVKQIEIELLAYDGRTVLLDVADEAIGELEKIKLGNGATLRVFEEDGKRFVTQFRIRSKDPNLAKVCSEEYLAGMNTGLQFWVDGGNAGNLKWGILHFHKGSLVTLCRFTLWLFNYSFFGRCVCECERLHLHYRSIFGGLAGLAKSPDGPKRPSNPRTVSRFV